MEIDDKGACTTCKKPVAQGPSSLTQWIFGRDNLCACNAGLLQAEESAPDVAIIECSNCNKEISQSDGTMTQWIFRARYCACASPAPKSVGRNVSTATIQEHKFESALAKFENIGEESLKGWCEELDRYIPLKKLGQGGAGSIFLCRDTLLNKLIAVKFLRHITPKAVISFQNEARISSKLDHPGIVRIIDFGVTDSSIPYMVMEPVAGINLKDHITEQGPLEETRVRDLAAGLCRSLAYAHKSGTLHRDIKTSNIIIRQDTAQDPRQHTHDPVLIDFGIAKFKEESLNEEDIQQETLAGSPEYMAPDVILHKKYTEASEVYSLGCVLFETLTGNVPFQGATALDTLSMHTSAEPPSLSEVRNDLAFSPEIQSIVSRCLEKDPALRFQSMAELETALLETKKKVGTETGTQFSNVEVPSTSTSPPGRQTIQRVLFISIAGAILIGIVATVIVALKQDDEAVRETQSKSTAAPVQTIRSVPSSPPAQTSLIQPDHNERKPVSSATVEMVPSIRITADSLPVQSTEITTSKLALVGMTSFGKMLWKRDGSIYFQDDAKKTYLPMPISHVTGSIPDQFEHLDKYTIKRHGASKFLGLNCEIYKCFDENKKMVAEFWATKELEIPAIAMKCFCQSYGMPETYGFPLRLKRKESLLVPINEEQWQASPSTMANFKLPPAKNGWIVQDVARVERLSLKSTYFEIPPDYKKAKNNYSFVGIDEGIFGPE